MTLFDSIFDDMMAAYPACRTGHFAPLVDIKENKENYVLEMELPGRCQDDVNIELDKNVLSISSKNEKEEEKEEKKEMKHSSYLLNERHTSEFKRNFTLPQDVNQEAISAEFMNGVLTITMPKMEVKAPKKILISAA